MKKLQLFFLMLTSVCVDVMSVGLTVHLPLGISVMLIVPLVLVLIMLDLFNDGQFIALVRYTIKDIMGER